MEKWKPLYLVTRNPYLYVANCTYQETVIVQYTTKVIKELMSNTKQWWDDRRIEE